jgi:hypothetical protein
MSPRSRSAGTAAAITAAVTGLVAFVLVLAGLGLLWANHHFKDGDGYVGTGSHRLAASSRAITAGDMNIDNPTWADGGWGTIRLRASSSKPVFIGVAPTRDVDAYLRGVDRSELEDVDLSPFRASYVAHRGERSPAAPAGQHFWIASAQGAGVQSLRWHPESGHWSVVVMNADGSPGVNAAVSAGAKLSFLTGLAWGTLIVGLLFVIATGVLMIFATRPVSPRPTAPTLATA